MAAPPVVGDVTQDVYEDLPELYRNADAAQADGPDNYPLLRYLAGILDQLTEVTTLADRFRVLALDDRDDAPGNEFGIPLPWKRFGTGNYGDGLYGDTGSTTGDLANPVTADSDWLPWLAQLVGADLDPLGTVSDWRDAILHASTTWDHGSPNAIRRDVAKVLTGTKYVEVVNYGGPTPDPQDAFTAVIRTKRAETTASTTWATLKAQAPTWDGINTLHTWANGRSAGVLLAAQAERPVGVAYKHAYVD